MLSKTGLWKLGVTCKNKKKKSFKSDKSEGKQGL